MADEILPYRLPAREFPVRFYLLDAATHELRWSAEVDDVAVLKIPGRAEVNDGRPVTAVVTTAAGHVEVVEPR